MPITMTGDFDGGNPKDPGRIARPSHSSFEVRPYSEDEDPNYKFRLDLKASNLSDRTINIRLTLDWGTGELMHFRDYLYFRGERDTRWSYREGTVDGSRTRLEISLAPGCSYLCLHPKYNYSDYVKYMDSLPESEIARKVKVGESGEGREIWGVHLADFSRPARKNIIVVGRVHPYETGGSFCVEGIIGEFLRNEGCARNILAKHNLLVVPMINPDGVYHGLCKRTSATGIDLSKKLDPDDRLCSVLMTLADRLRPSAYIEFHNWMFKDRDGIYFMNALECLRFTRSMPSQAQVGKSWKPMLRRKLFATDAIGLKKYCRERFGALVACLEYPWFRRGESEMRCLGFQTIAAISRMA
jgi:hypothetical protein